MIHFISAAAKRIRRIFGIFLIIVLALLIALIVYILVCNVKGRVAEVFGYSVMRVVTGSMEPAIHTGDYILIGKTDTSELRVGDIICFYSEDEEIFGMPNTHRIYEITEDGFITKGDANSVEDSVSVSPDRIIGIYKGKIGFLRWVNSFASGRKILMIFVIIPMLCVSVYEVVTIKKLAKTDADNNGESEYEAAVRAAIDKEKARLYAENYKEGETDDRSKTDNEN